MSNPKISVIVPVYNAEKFLHRCIDSILEQTFTNFEVLLVNDGSKDQSGIICDEYATKDSRIRVFHKENGGVSSARNIGITNALFDYLALIDSDDYWDINYLSYIVGLINKYPECAVYGARQTVVSQKNKRLSNIEPLSENFEGVIENYFLQADSSFLFHTSATVFTKKNLSRNNILYNNNLSRGEDLDVLFRAIYCGQKVCFTTKALTFYDYTTEGSLMKTTTSFENRYMALLLNSDYLEKYNSKEFKAFINNYLFSCSNLLIYESADRALIDKFYSKIKFKNLSLKKRLLYLLPLSIKRKLLKRYYDEKQ